MATGITRPIQSNSHLGRKDYSIFLLIFMDLLTAFKACFGPGVCFCLISKIRDIKQVCVLSYILLIKWGILLPYKTYHRMAWVANGPYRSSSSNLLPWAQLPATKSSTREDHPGQCEGGTITSLPMLITPFLVQPKIQLAFWVARTLFWLLPIFSSTRIPTCSLTGLRSESINKCPLLTGQVSLCHTKTFPSWLCKLDGIWRQLQASD